MHQPEGDQILASVPGPSSDRRAKARPWKDTVQGPPLADVEALTHCIFGRETDLALFITEPTGSAIGRNDMRKRQAVRNVRPGTEPNFCVFRRSSSGRTIPTLSMMPLSAIDDTPQGREIVFRAAAKTLGEHAGVFQSLGCVCRKN